MASAAMLDMFNPSRGVPDAGAGLLLPQGAAATSLAADSDNLANSGPTCTAALPAARGSDVTVWDRAALSLPDEADTHGSSGTANNCDCRCEGCRGPGPGCGHVDGDASCSTWLRRWRGATWEIPVASSRKSVEPAVMRLVEEEERRRMRAVHPSLVFDWEYRRLYETGVGMPRWVIDHDTVAQVCGALPVVACDLRTP